MGTKTRAAVAVIEEDGGYSVGYADKDINGYTPTTYRFSTYEEARECARSLNVMAFQLTDDEAWAIVASSMTAEER